MIHKTHSKKDLYEVIKVFKIPIYNNTYTKKQLIKVLKDAIASGLFYINDKDRANKYLITNEYDLKEYLNTCNPKKLLSVKDKKQLIQDCRRLNQYCLNNYIIDNTTFKSEQEVNELCEQCSKYGDIPSVRKMIKRFNNNPMVEKTVKPVISNIIQKELNDKKIIKQVHMCNLIIKQGPFNLSFD